LTKKNPPIAKVNPPSQIFIKLGKIFMKLGKKMNFCSWSRKLNLFKIGQELT